MRLMWNTVSNTILCVIGLILALGACSHESTQAPIVDYHRSTVEISAADRKMLVPCFDKAVERNPQFTGGELDLNTYIGSDGKLGSSTIQSSTTQDPKFDACVLEKSKSWRLPESEQRKFATLKLHLTNQKASALGE